MKKIFSVIGLLAIVLGVFTVNPGVVNAKDSVSSGTLYGTLKIDESEGWLGEAGSRYITQTYYVTKTIGGYVYLNLVETLNVDITSIIASNKFTKIMQEDTDDGVSVLLKAKDGVTVSSETEVFTVVADIIDESNLQCNLSPAPLALVCEKFDNLYFDKNGKEVTEAEYKESCEGGTPPTQDELPPDDPGDPVPETPETGSAIPYVAIGGGLLAIAGLYLYSRKSNKMYKI